MQSQDYPGAKWALGQRLGGVTDADVDAQFDAGAIVRTHVLRPTWHFVAPADLRWLQALTGPRVHVANGYQYRSLGIDDELARAARGIFERRLEGGRSATRDELGMALRDGGIEASAMRLGYLVSHAELEAVLVSGPRRGKLQTYALVEERIPAVPTRERDEALAELSRRYVEGHGPAQSIDLAWWSGLTLRDARRALEAASPPLVTETVGDRLFWVSPTSAGVGERRRDADGSPLVHLLPNYDELLIAFRDRSDAMDADLPSPARVAEVVLAHIVVRDGLVVGGWNRSDDGSRASLTLDLFVGFGHDERASLRAAVDRLERFLGRPVEASGFD